MLAKPGIVCYNSFCCTARSTDGKLAQLGEHPLDVWKVVGSSPILSRKASPKGGAFFVFVCENRAGGKIPPARLQLTFVVIRSRAHFHTGIQLIIFTLLGNQVIMCATLNNAALLENHDAVRIADG